MTRKQFAGMAALCVAGLAPIGTAHAQRGASPINDKLFAAAAAGAGMSEVALAQMAEQRGADAETKMFAKHMVADHGKANQELMALAATKGIPLPSGLAVADQITAEILGGLRGEEFDREYAKQQLAAHLCAVTLFHAEATRGQDPELKAFAARTLPHLRKHLEAIHKIAKMEMDKSAEDHK